VIVFFTGYPVMNGSGSIASNTEQSYMPLTFGVELFGHRIKCPVRGGDLLTQMVFANVAPNFG